MNLSGYLLWINNNMKRIKRRTCRWFVRQAQGTFPSVCKQSVYRKSLEVSQTLSAWVPPREASELLFIFSSLCLKSQWVKVRLVAVRGPLHTSAALSVSAPSGRCEWVCVWGDLSMKERFIVISFLHLCIWQTPWSKVIYTIHLFLSVQTLELLSYRKMTEQWAVQTITTPD